jgi:hypothetical protein
MTGISATGGERTGMESNIGRLLGQHTPGDGVRCKCQPLHIQLALDGPAVGMNTNSMNRASVIGNNKVKYCFHIAVSIRELGGTSAWWRIVASKSTSPSSSRCLMIANVRSPFGVPAFVTTTVTGVPKGGPSSTRVVAQEWLYVNEKIANCQVEP